VQPIVAKIKALLASIGGPLASATAWLSAAWAKVSASPILKYATYALAFLVGLKFGPSIISLAGDLLGIVAGLLKIIGKLLHLL
jgi:hypothetical protein